MIRKQSLLLALVALFAATGASAQFSAADARRTSIKGGLGFSVDPDTFLMGFEVDQPVAQQFSVVPRLEIGVSDDDFLISPTVSARYWFDLTHTNLGGLRPLRPFVNAGLGLTYMDEEGPNDDDGVGMLIPLGFGAEWPITRELALGTDFRFNIIPVGAENESFYFAWEVLGLRYRF